MKMKFFTKFDVYFPLFWKKAFQIPQNLENYNTAYIKFHTPISKCPDIRENLTPSIALRMLLSLSIKLKLLGQSLWITL